jgi:hypothetical protein
MGKKNSLFDRAFDKAARAQPGQPANLTEAEDQVLVGAIKAYDRRKHATMERFLEHVKKEGIDLTEGQAKQVFKQMWAEGRFS